MGEKHDRTFIRLINQIVLILGGHDSYGKHLINFKLPFMNFIIELGRKSYVYHIIVREWGFKSF